MPKQAVQCEYCGAPLVKYISQSVKTKRFFCNREHKHQFMKSVSYEELYGEEQATRLRAVHSANNSGCNNPNFDNKWSEERKTKFSEKKKLFYADNPDVAYECGKSNRGKKFSEDRIQRMHSHRTSESYSHSHTDASKKIIGEKSAEKWTDEYKAAHRAKMEKAGCWIPLDRKSDWEIYQKLANWQERMFDIVDDPHRLLDIYGVFNAHSNTKGVVRDHIYSRKSGFFEGVFPEILRHPANCQILTHADNVAKKSQRYVDRNDITLVQLFEAIRRYNKPWREQKLVLQLIEDYEHNKRHERK